MHFCRSAFHLQLKDMFANQSKLMKRSVSSTYYKKTFQITNGWFYGDLLICIQILFYIHLLKTSRLFRNVSNEKSDMAIKLIDFGTATTFYEKNTTLNGTQGTCYYIAPEVLSRSYNEKCDMWSCGVILYILLSGTPPFDGQCDEEILERIRRGTFNFKQPCWATISQEAKTLISALCVQLLYG